MLQDQYYDVTYFINMIKNKDYVARIAPIYITDKEILFGLQYQNNYLHALNNNHSTTIINNYQNFLGIPKFSISTNDAILPVSYQNGYFYYLVEPALIPDKFKKLFSHTHKLSQLDENSNPILLRIKLSNSDEK